MKIIQLELFNLPPDELLKQLRLPEVPKSVNHALNPEAIREVAYAAVGQKVSDKVIAQALVQEFLARLPQSKTVNRRRGICLN